MSYENGSYCVARSIGENAAIIKLNGQSDDYVKDYVSTELCKGGVKHLRNVAREGYSQVMKTYKNLDPNRDLLIVKVNLERHQPITFTKDKDKVILKRHLPQATVSNQLPFCRAMQY